MLRGSVADAVSVELASNSVLPANRETKRKFAEFGTMEKLGTPNSERIQAIAAKFPILQSGKLLRGKQ